MTRRARSHRLTAALLIVACATAGAAIPNSPAGAAPTSAAVSALLPPLELTFPEWLPPGQIDVPYSEQLTAIGGVEPYTWAVIPGNALPAWLTLDANSGVLSGTPTEAGRRTFQVTVTDSDETSASRDATLEVATPAITLTSEPTVEFGVPSVLTATVLSPPAEGYISFNYVPASGPHQGETLTLNAITLDDNSQAVLTIPIPFFGANVMSVRYSGDRDHDSGISVPITVEVIGYPGQVIISEFRESGPRGQSDNYLELYNAGPPVPLGGFTIESASQDPVTIPLIAGVLGTGRSYLLASANYSLDNVTPYDQVVDSVGVGGHRVLAPDTDGNQTDAVGAISEYALGNPLPLLEPSDDQQAWVRNVVAGVPHNTGDNLADFRLVTGSGVTIGDVQSTLGAPSPTSSSSPYQQNSLMWSTLISPAVSAAVEPNRAYSAGSPGVLIVRRTIKNLTGATIHQAKLRVTALSAVNGGPRPGGGAQPQTHANLRVISGNAGRTEVTAPGQGRIDWFDLNLDPPSDSFGEGGLNSTLTIPLNGGLVANATVNIAVWFAVDVPGPFWFGYDIDASATALPNRSGDAVQRRGVSPAPLIPRVTGTPDTTVHGVL